MAAGRFGTLPVCAVGFIPAAATAVPASRPEHKLRWSWVPFRLVIGYQGWSANPPSEKISLPSKSAITFLRLAAGRSTGRRVSSVTARVHGTRGAVVV